MKRTFMATREDALKNRRWHLVDAEGKVLGRLACQIANILRGKNKPSFTPHEDTGDFVVVINAASLRLTGNKVESKLYRRHTGWPGGIRERAAKTEIDTHPERMLRHAVVGMLPKNRLGRQLATKVKIYRGADHPHAAQQPTPVSE
jgi:large subunit ribosomal protein L13